MPGLDGVAATRQILRRWPDARIIAVTASEEESSARQLLKAGALGYVTKTSDIDTLHTAIRRVLKGERYLSGALSQRIDASRVSVGCPFDDLSGREFEITKHVVAGRRAQEIADRLYITKQTVHTYRYRIFEKLGVHSDVELTRMAMRHGLFKDGFG